MNARTRLRSPLRKISMLIAITTVGFLVISPSAPVSARPTRTPAETATPYQVMDVRTLAQRNTIVATGVSLDGVADGVADITATPSEVAQLRKLGFTVLAVSTTPDGSIGTESFPAADSGYHDYAEMNADLRQIVAAHPDIASLGSIGLSFQGRDMPVLKISDNVATDEAEPEVLLEGHMHAREHLTVEMGLFLAHLFTDRYGTDTRITNIVDNREIWIIPDMNPDGGEFDIATGTYQSWRKNRQPNSGTTAVGTDINRNFGFMWACCNGSSSSPSSGTYHGPFAFSSPESQRLRDFVLSRRIAGTQQIKVAIDFHTFSELVLWPFGFTTANTATGLNADQANVFITFGRQMAATNGYTPEQISDLAIADGSGVDWMWGDQGIFAWAFEMFPKSSTQGGFYPGDEIISRETARNQEAMLLLAELADCPYRAIGKEAQLCSTGGGGGGGGTTVFSDSFETSTGWTRNPDNTDTATTGIWERGDPEPTDSNGPKQLDLANTGTNALITGLAAGGSAGANDVDGGVTSAQSPAITLPSTGTLTLSLAWYLAHASNSTVDDFLRVSVVTSTGTTVVLSQAGSALDVDAAWTTVTADLSAFAGQTVRILVQAGDVATGSLLEAGIDDVTITQT
jgi:carboxypeptidase T